MSNVHYISPEPDRRACEAMKNIINMKRYRNERARLDRMKDRLAREAMQRHATVPIMATLIPAISAGHALLEAGGSFEQAMAEVERCAEALSC